MQEMTRPMRHPVSTDGNAAGSTTVNKAFLRDAPVARADQTSLGSTAFVP
jgi:hypothetical protein